MNSIKGFANIAALANNADGQTATFGELSYLSKSYSRHQTNYVLPSTYPAVEFISFSSKNDTGTIATISSAAAAHILAVTSWVYDQHSASTIPSNINKTAFISALTTEFANITNVEINEILNGSPSTKRMPDYIKWRYNDSGTLLEIKVWFSDARFQTQYDDYEILISPPVANINTLDNTPASVGAQIAAITPSAVFTNMNVLMGNFPTRTIAHPITWVYPTNPAVTITTYWYLALYGPMATDLDNIKNAIRDYISDNSALTVWQSIYPSLYADNEFVIIPLWNNVAVPETTIDPALFGSMTNVNKLKTVATALIPQTYAQSTNISTFLNQQLVVASAFYRSLMFMAVGNPTNVNADYSFAAKYPDYMDVDSGSADFARLTQNTQDFIIALNTALSHAKDLTMTSAIPVGYTRVVRNSRVYLAFVYGAFTYMVLAMISYSE